MKNKIISREGLLNAFKKDTTVEYAIPDSDTVVLLRHWSALERASILDIMEKEYSVDVEEMTKSPESASNIKVTYKALFTFMLHVVAHSLCDADGNRLVEDIYELESLPSEVLSSIHEKALAMNGVGDGSVKDAVKNSETTQN
jgi:hypothetical protein